MRIKLNLRTVQNHHCIPINYQYPLSAVIYRILSDSSPEYSQFLHDRGYLGLDGKLRKLFTFSRLDIQPRADVKNDMLIAGNHNRIMLTIASPMIEDFIQHFVIGLFQNQYLEIANNKTKCKLLVEQVESCPEPDFTSEMTFRAISPIVLTRVVEQNNSLGQYYFRPLDTGLSEAAQKSLTKKFQTITGKTPTDTTLRLKIDQDYIARRGGPERVMTMVKIREGRRDQTNVKGFLAPLKLTGSIDLIRTAWQAGIGDRCSQGFGCVEIAGR